MKKVIYQSLYRIFLSLSNHFDSRFFVKCKILLGTALIVLTSSCSKENDEPELMCYDPAPPPPEVTCYLAVPCKETAETHLTLPSSAEDTIHIIEQKRLKK